MINELNDEINKRIDNLKKIALKDKDKFVRDNARGAFHELQELRLWISEQQTTDKSQDQPQKEALIIGDVSNCPVWLSRNELKVAKELYAKKRLDGIKYLTEKARPYKKYALKWSKELLEGCC